MYLLKVSVYSFIVFIVGGISQTTIAAEIYFKNISNSNEQSSTSLIEVRIDPNSKQLNVVDGEILIKEDGVGDISLEIQNGSSTLPLWPIPPSYDQKKKIITFSGGIPNGFSDDSFLFLLKISSEIPRDVTLSFKSSTAYLNDGKGTAINIFGKPLTVSLGENNIGEEESVVIPVNTIPDFKKNGTLFLLIIVIPIVFVWYGYKKKSKK